MLYLLASLLLCFGAQNTYAATFPAGGSFQSLLVGEWTVSETVVKGNANDADARTAATAPARTQMTLGMADTYQLDGNMTRIVESLSEEDEEVVAAGTSGEADALIATVDVTFADAGGLSGSFAARGQPAGDSAAAGLILDFDFDFVAVARNKWFSHAQTESVTVDVWVLSGSTFVVSRTHNADQSVSTFVFERVPISQSFLERYATPVMMLVGVVVVRMLLEAGTNKALGGKRNASTAAGVAAGKAALEKSQ